MRKTPVLMCTCDVAGNCLGIIRTQNWTGGTESSNQLDAAADRAGQGFKVSQASLLCSMTIVVKRNGAAPGNTTLRVFAADGAGKPTGPELASRVLNSDGWSGAKEDMNYVFVAPLFTLQAGTQYTWTLDCVNTTGDISIYHRVDTGGTYADGKYWWSTDSGATWVENHVDTDLSFRVYV